MSMSDQSLANGKTKERSHVSEEDLRLDEVIKSSNSSSKDQDHVSKIGLLEEIVRNKELKSNKESLITRS
uniref:Uncharacterized protein n=1 Tax=Tanacetum cinerariifolium TaxID=118510 RepID=A0A699HNX8_TANCI|nr:hypothetical protein [Tanacetum cinerariifolium]